MSLTDVIDSFETDELVVTRAVDRGTIGADGIFVPGATTTFTTICTIEPATGQQRVVGGLDMHAMPSGDAVDDVRVIYTRDQLLPESVQRNADHVSFEGANWLVFRCETWNLTGDIFYRVTITRVTNGAA